ncbi:AMP-binding protein [Pseudonocardia parietis]|uniref:Long-chain acyl-CoA synthetase n=1 Tax=Pseudonocardia parietis TaxID=570936 RepID=A0ABS4VL66_9PSEU|nr:AMP-binding protein [Pseudonocardia parietis]MBP2364670.1 long-chain acyl-CoA synthetase [Pseudonocardia parietis]
MRGARSRTAPPHGPEPVEVACGGSVLAGPGPTDDAPIVSALRLPRAPGAEVIVAEERLRASGARATDRVVLDAPARSRWDVLPYLLAADRIGAASLVADPSWSGRERYAVLADAAPRLVVRVDSAGHPVTAVPGRGPGTTAPELPGTESTSARAAFLLPTTSGSTGAPTVLARTRRSWWLGFDALGPLPGPVLVPGPPSSTLYLFGALHALHHGLGLTTTDRFDPVDARTAGTVHLVPPLLSALLDDREHHPGHPAPRVIVCGGAHVTAAERERCARLLPDTVLLEYYGSAEHSLIALRRSDVETPGGRLHPVGGVHLELHDGVLWVDSPQAALGRMRDGVLEPAAPGASTVGDRAELGDDGSLTVLGRSSATISSGGALVAAEEVEQVLHAVPGVAGVVVGGSPHPSLGMLVTAVVEPRRGATVSRRDLRAAARNALSPAKRPRRWLVTGALPRLGSGKPARAAVADGLRDGTLDAAPFDDTRVRPPATDAPGGAAHDH